MRFSEWEPVYSEILDDLGLERSSDEASARSLKILTMNSDMISEDELAAVIGKAPVVAGGSISAADLGTLGELRSIGKAIISAGSATDVLVAGGIIPDIVVTDLDGNIELQKKASASGSVTLVHAHGDNSRLMAEHVKDLRGKIMITTQSVPDLTLCNFGGFTDGDRAVCTARHFGAKEITLIGFDMERPVPKQGTDAEMKKKKLAWAKRIIFDMNPDDVILRMI